VPHLNTREHLLGAGTAAAFAPQYYTASGAEQQEHTHASPAPTPHPDLHRLLLHPAH